MIGDATYQGSAGQDGKEAHNHELEHDYGWRAVVFPRFCCRGKCLRLGRVFSLWCCFEKAFLIRFWSCLRVEKRLAREENWRVKYPKRGWNFSAKMRLNSKWIVLTLQLLVQTTRVPNSHWSLQPHLIIFPAVPIQILSPRVNRNKNGKWVVPSLIRRHTKTNVIQNS